MRRTGLIGAGKAHHALFARMPALLERLGPVRGPSIRVAARMVNSLRAGYAAREYAAFEECGLILISVPDRDLSKAVAGLTAERAEWRGRTAVVCDSWLDSSELRPLRELGAGTGSLQTVPGSDDRLVLIEGQRQVVRELSGLTRGAAEAIEIAEGKKPALLAALTLMENVFMPLLSAGETCLRDAGLSRGKVDAVLEQAFTRAWRSYTKGRGKAWGGPLAERSARVMAPQLDALARLDPDLEAFFRQHVLLALEHLKKDGDWFRAIPPGALD